MQAVFEMNSYFSGKVCFTNRGGFFKPTNLVYPFSTFYLSVQSQASEGGSGHVSG